MHSYSGGGATHIALKSGKLEAFSNDYSSNLLIVAGGGGGAVEKVNFGGKCSVGGCGGGFSGAEGNCPQGSERAGKGGTQQSGGIGGPYSDHGEDGIFGQGGNCVNSGYAKGGGGGGFYGGGSGGNSGPGGGGSGYINTSKLSDAFMYGYNVQTSSDLESKTYSTTNVSSDAISNYAKKGNGFARITLLESK